MARIRLSAVAFLISAVVLLAPSPARAITYGFVDSTNAYPNVGAFNVKSNATGHIFPICSGTLIASNVFLTAGHCTAFFEFELAPDFTAWVSFDGSIPFGNLTSNTTNLIEVTHVVTNPNYNQRQSDPGDIGVLILGSSPEGISPATLPACNLLDRLSAHNGLKDAVFTAVGYGVQNRVVGGGVPYFQDMNPIPRMYAFSSFDALSPGYIRLSQNPSNGNGGTCFGDSGGPNFLAVDGQTILAAITITGDAVCRSTNVDYRLDLSSAQGFFEFVNSTYGTAIPTSC
ncbi:MAG TPA: trypsin-like serine protease [Thermoanaerobaculia bacterium]